MTGTGAGTLVTQCPQPSLGKPMLRRLSAAEFQQTLTAVFPEVAGKWQSSLPSDTVSAYGFNNDASAEVGNQTAQAIFDTATSLAVALTGTVLPTILPCSTSSPNAACATQFLTKYGKRLFRRPLTQAEQTQYLGFFTSALGISDFKTAIKWMTIGLIQSPNAVYRSEIGAQNAQGTYQLSPYEIATELAYTYTGGPPDDTMLSKADTNTVGDPVAWAKAQLATSAGKQALQQFFRGYLGYTGVVSIEKANIATFDTNKNDMVTETQDFITNILFPAQGPPGGLTALLTSPATYPSKALATYYALGSPMFPIPASDFAMVTRPMGQGVGLLAQGSFLSTHAAPDSSSPTQRGLFIFQHLLCETKHDPPKNVPPIGSPQPGVKTTRQRYEEHDSNGCTTGCHDLFDPIGYGFEHFDEGGKYRVNDNGLPIDTASYVPNPDGTKGAAFTSQEDLMQALTKMPVSYACFTAYLATYAYGTGESCLGASQVADFQAGKIGIADVFVGLASAPHFSSRTTQ
jgi:hypothetical protein